MKTIVLFIIAAVFYTATVLGQDSGLPGEDFDLEALPGIIETVSTFEDLEKALNTEKNEINNLDLNEDGEVDYILIQMENEKDTYVAFLRVAISETEMQDIATIEMEKKSSTAATFQIVGDEALYGKDYILEPEGGVVDISESSSGSSGGKGGPSAFFVPPPPAVRVTICVGVFRPGFRIWVSPWGFMVHPAWFRPWHPVARHYYRTRAARWHRSAYMRTAHRKSHHAHNMHKKHHRSSAKVTHHKSSAPKKSTTRSTVNSKPKNSTTSASQTKSTTQQKSTNQQKNTSQQKSTNQPKSSTQQRSNTQQKSTTQQRTNTQQKGGAKKGGRR